MKRLAALAVALAPAIVFAADAPEADVTAGLVKATLGLALVVGLVLGVAWVARRVSPGVAGGGGPLRIVGSRSVGQRERVVVVEIEQQWLVLGVAPGSVNALATLPKGTLPPPAQPVPAFADLLKRAKGR
jgi:flagellar protein FliO/FliZ